MSKDFRRTSSHEKIKLGKRNKRKQKWRRARGRHNKIREDVHGKPRKVKVGYRNIAKTRGLIEGKVPVMIRNIKDAEKAEKKNIAIIASVGKRLRVEIEKILAGKDVKIVNRRKHESKK